MGTRDFEPLLGKARAADPDVVYMISNDVEEAALLVRQTKRLDFKFGFPAIGSVEDDIHHASSWPNMFSCPLGVQRSRAFYCRRGGNRTINRPAVIAQHGMRRCQV